MLVVAYSNFRSATLCGI